MAVSCCLLLFGLLLHGADGWNISASEPLPSELFKRLFSLLFPNASSLCYIFQSDSLQLAHFLSLPVTMVQYQNASILLKMERSCQGFVLSVKDVGVVQRYLRLRTVRYGVLKPHRRIAVVYERAAQIHLQELLGLYAMDVVEVEMPGDALRLRRLSANRVIFQWNLTETEFFLDEAGFAQEEWEPTAFARQFNYTFQFAVFGCEPFILAQNKRIRGGPEINLALEMTRGLPLRFVFADATTVAGIAQKDQKDQKPFFSAENPWAEALNLVKRNEVDMAGCSQYVANQWRHSIDFTVNQNQICQTFLVPKARPSSDVHFLIEAFSGRVWLCLLLGAVGFGAVGRLLLVAWPAGGGASAWITPMLDVLRLYSAGGVFVTGGNLASCPARIYFLFLLFHGFLISTYYSAGLSSTLTVPKLIRQINTLQDLVDYGITFQEQSGIVAAFDLVNSSLFRGLARLHSNQPRSSTPLDGLTAMTVKTLDNSYVTDLDGFEPDKLKDYKALKECIGNHYMGFALQRESPFKRRFDTVAMRIMESGLLRKWLHEQIYQKSALQAQFFSSYAQNAHYRTITARRLYGAFVLLLVGYGSGALALLVEMVFNKNV
ncbi:hypothetical protein HUJ05_011056 [Dendroctonus ponderosae]|nr:hypothetical protein HUJ05_011056 [Dendroctonus ponderosae]